MCCLLIFIDYVSYKFLTASVMDRKRGLQKMNKKETDKQIAIINLFMPTSIQVDYAELDFDMASPLFLFFYSLTT